MAQEQHVELGDDVGLDADEYCIGIDEAAGELRLQFHNDEIGLLSSFVTDAAGAYDLAHRILRAYDKLEGL